MEFFLHTTHTYGAPPQRSLCPLRNEPHAGPQPLLLRACAVRVVLSFLQRAPDTTHEPAGRRSKGGGPFSLRGCAQNPASATMAHRADDDYDFLCVFVSSSRLLSAD